MSLFIYDYVIWLQIPIDDVLFVKVFKSQENLAQIGPCSIFSHSLFSLNHASHISSRTVIENQEESRRSLESIVQTNDERVFSEIGKNVSLGSRVSNQLTIEVLLFLKYFHSIEFRLSFLLHKVHLAKRAFTQKLNRNE